MFDLRLYALIFTALESASEVDQRSGVLHVSGFARYGFSRCHYCLVKSMGVRNIYLLNQRTNERVYWIMGHSDMARAFVDYCNSEWKCHVLQYAGLSYSLADLKRIDLQQRDSIGDPQNFESSIFRFFHSIEHNFQKLKGHLSNEHPPNWTNGLSSFMRKRELSIPVFFPKKKVKRMNTLKQRMIPWKQNRVLLDPCHHLRI